MVSFNLIVALGLVIAAIFVLPKLSETLKSGESFIGGGKAESETVKALMDQEVANNQKRLGRRS